MWHKWRVARKKQSSSSWRPMLNPILYTILQKTKQLNIAKLEMWANAQRDGRPAEHRWRPLFNAAKFGWRSLLYCCAVTLPRREDRWNLEGCPKLVNRSQPLVGRSSPYCGHVEDIWCLTSFFHLLLNLTVKELSKLVTYTCIYGKVRAKVYRPTYFWSYCTKLPCFSQSVCKEVTK